LVDHIAKEVIIVNDCSKDNTEEAITDYQSKNPELNIQYFKHEVNKGKGAALHTGIEKATGEYLVIKMQTWNTTPKNITCYYNLF
jgi:glycosyltransferase involved in cell wall biosynthesis